MRLIRRTFLAIGIAFAGLAAYADDAKLSVVATTGMIADVARQVGGDRVDVQSLMGPGVDPHAYRQTRTDIVALTRADLVLWHGLFLEAQMQDFFGELAERKPVVALADALDPETLIASADYADAFDPHVWMDPALWEGVVEAAKGALTEADPEGAEIFAANAAAHIKDLRALRAYVETSTQTVPEQARVLVTAHDAFSYFGTAFGFEVLGIQGISTESEAGLNRIQELVDILVERQIGAVFVESSVSDRNIRALIEGAAAQGHDLAIGGELFSDAMGPDGTYEGTYLGMIDHNATTIAAALGGTVPERGMTGQLSAGY